MTKRTMSGGGVVLLAVALAGGPALPAAAQTAAPEVPEAPVAPAKPVHSRKHEHAQQKAHLSSPGAITAAATAAAATTAAAVAAAPPAATAAGAIGPMTAAAPAAATTEPGATASATTAPAAAAPATSAPTQHAAAAPTMAPPPAAAPAAPPPPRAPAAAEKQISDLHRALKITAAQTPQWDAFAQVMRENAIHMAEVSKVHPEHATALNAVDGLKSYEAVTQAHLDDLQKLEPAFAALYETMSPSQKRVADGMFQHRATTAKVKKKEPTTAAVAPAAPTATE